MSSELNDSFFTKDQNIIVDIADVIGHVDLTFFAPGEKPHLDGTVNIRAIDYDDAMVHVWIGDYSKEDPGCMLFDFITTISTAMASIGQMLGDDEKKAEQENSKAAVTDPGIAVSPFLSGWHEEF